MRKVTALGAAAPEADDVSAWVARSREAETEAKRAAERAAAAKLSSMYDEEVRLVCLWVPLTRSSARSSITASFRRFSRNPDGA